MLRAVEAVADFVAVGSCRWRFTILGAGFASAGCGGVSPGALATVTAVQEPGRFGAIYLSSERPRAARFGEKDVRDGQVTNGGFFVVEPEALDTIDGDSASWENELLARLIEQDQLAVYRHHGYWQNMDTLRDQAVLQEQWDSGKPPWCVWNNEPASR